ncbi:hypothetical protein [Oceanobacter sp. 3_MG-2023]|uniref:hypothetical protein n=1 Tax=Oceanobacter sp. 3_MG-2023 TaxID=3062622 RepID=UPI0027367EF0|nr:hypothetical protein [Oceanobacter sp. 3_MG-2023]MDP2505417.1 hypothetical protein [Oceanobacter sp. 3_MG-2023]
MKYDHRFTRYEDRETLERIQRWPNLAKRFAQVSVRSAACGAYWKDGKFTATRNNADRFSMKDAMALCSQFNTQHEIQLVQAAASRNTNNRSQYPKQKPRWSQQEVDQLIKSSQNKTANQIAEDLGKTASSVWSKVRYLRRTTHPDLILQKNGEQHHLTKYTEQDVELSRQLSEAGLPHRIIAEKMEAPMGTIHGWCAFHCRRSAATN